MRSRLPWLLFTLAVITINHGAWAWYPHGDKYAAWQKKNPMIYGAWFSCNAEDSREPGGRQQDRVRRFAAVGFNDLLWIKANHRPWFIQAHKLGLTWRTGMRGSFNQVNDIISKTPGTSALITAYGPYDTLDDMEDLTEWSQWSRDNFPDLLSYAIILERGTNYKYKRYIEACQPDILAVELFVIDTDGSIKPEYHSQLAKLAKTAKQYHLPLWVQLQSFEPITAKPRLPSFAASQLDGATMRAQTFLALAHGVTGVHYFMYYGYELGMVVDLGTPTPGSRGSGIRPTQYENTVLTRSWYAARDMAPEIHRLGKSLIHMRLDGDVTYSGQVPEQCSPFEGRGHLLAAAIVNDSAATMQVNTEPENPSSLAVSFLTDQAGEEYFMIVNMVHGSRMSKLDGARTVRLTFDKNVTHIQRHSRHTGNIVTLVTDTSADGSRFLEFHLEGGTGDLFKWSNGNPWALDSNE